LLAADDITAWCLLAVVIAIVKAVDFYQFCATAYYVVAMIFIFEEELGDLYGTKDSIGKIMAIFLSFLILSSYATEWWNSCPLWTFMMGSDADVTKFQIYLSKVGDVAVILLLPLFFVFTGLRDRNRTYQ
jgi:Kef-type K+ transport system membrane component KefB